MKEKKEQRQANKIKNNTKIERNNKWKGNKRKNKNCSACFVELKMKIHFSCMNKKLNDYNYNACFSRSTNIIDIIKIKKCVL